MKPIDGGICAVRGVHAGGIKPGKNGLGVITASGNSAGVFTRNKVIAAPLIVTRERITEKGHLSAVIMNSGNANAFTGEEGIDDSVYMAKLLADKLDIPDKQVGVASTGVIGKKLDTDWLDENIDEVLNSLSNSPDGSQSAARSIMTTDTFAKESAIELNNGIRIGGIAKGSGMIEPNMGTMLAFIYTDAVLDSKSLNKSLKAGVDKSFNMIVVDGDTSTNDMVLLTATGESGVETDINDFQEGLDFVLTDLAKMIARDGEGATKLIEVNVDGAFTYDDARLVAKSIVRSPLVKTAIFGHDPNWGRIIAAIGYSGANIRQDKISLAFSDGKNTVELVKNGRIVTNDRNSQDALKNIMEKKDIKILINLGMDNKSATAWGCDLTYDYIKINAEYTT
ncbi:arginine biosynthesis bifunctional protein ArgJ [Methanohalobium evestigatum Z-7303]|uniref:Glutamate N-acetyltransferase n=1 Tax=Methanohalobium evestigatum (strain ATCC BAA-1072 / DSM 3721 / NBRC 107634 / OCM 161 / Z-7303) TaxID=644295 RepID=D7E8P2_METEZ|nr:bifunctional ornithine acetyltransferase/N-acetylglutamate synthase [Methanohalobium evestigatum]ADI73713.1 arginine biosynthesis bifunctional protein ArgJ [Methanohalobium evestigatum Z-7303]